LQAPKSTPPAAKQALILTWIQNSRVAHSIKDLEKALPSVASINGMQVKDYLQALSDDSKIRVEKIGSGNWYWSFLSEEKKNKQNVLDKCVEERDKAVAALAELQEKVRVAGEAREEDEDMLLGGGDGRGELMSRHEELVKELKGLREELATYSENDPVEVDRKRRQIMESRARAEVATEQIQSMEGWFKEQMGGDAEQLLGLKRTYYGDQFDEEEGGLREL
ncbi:meiotic nuclear division protein 1, partial [Saccharata proteae CBS 121410]